MAKVGVIKEIWRFPVKSMQGDTVERCTVSKQGLLGDRCWAMRDEGRKEVQWGKKYPQLMLCKARYREESDGGDIKPVDITFPDGETVGSDDAAVHAKLTELIGREAMLWPLQPASDVKFYKRYKPDEEQFMTEMADAFAREPGEPVPDMSQFPEVLMDHVSVPGTFFDNEELHMITTASMRYMASKNPAASWDIRRFRPNFYIETDSGLEGLVENEWVGRRLRIGATTVEISAPTPRCGMTVRPQGDLDYDKSILRTIVKDGDQNLGVGAHFHEGGEVRVGDTVEVLD
ncbi:MAG: MOSC N-terminal beta barrel domain-containing protein [Gammaproteobacteria bacterium]|nr:MOSC N-terminal beta barrel domain-containing protein [Gammaproteobacteria bacterium]